VGSQVKADGNTSRSMSKGLVRRGGIKERCYLPQRLFTCQTLCSAGVCCIL